MWKQLDEAAWWGKKIKYFHMKNAIGPSKASEFDWIIILTGQKIWENLPAIELTVINGITFVEKLFFKILNRDGPKYY